MTIAELKATAPPLYQEHPPSSVTEQDKPVSRITRVNTTLRDDYIINGVLDEFKRRLGGYADIPCEVFIHTINALREQAGGEDDDAGNTFRAGSRR